MLVILWRPGATEAQKPAISLRQFQHTAWTLQDGAPSQINALAQTTDGYLWLGTVNGLFRFDGVTFEGVHLQGGQRFSKTSIQSLAAGKDGGLWIGYTFGDIDFLKDGKLHEQRYGSDYAGATAYSIVEDLDGGMWAATIDGLIHLVSGVWHQAEESKGLNIRSCYALYRDRSGALWLSTDDYLYRLPRGAHRFEKTNILGGAGAVVREAPDGSIWTMDERGILRADPATAQHGKASAHVKTDDETVDLLFDEWGGLWVLGAKHGLTRFERPEAALQPANVALNERLGDHFSSLQGLSSDVALASLTDREGDIWIGGAGGVDRFRRSVFDPAPLPLSFGQYALAALSDGSLLIGTQLDGLQKLSAGVLSKVKDVHMNDVSCIYAAPDGKVWLGGKGDLGYLDGGRFFPVTVPDNIRAKQRDTQAMTTGPTGDLWMQVAGSGQTFLKWHAGKWKSAAGANSPLPVALTLMTDQQHRVWAGYLNGVIRIFNPDGTVTRLNKDSGVTVGNVSALYDSGNTIWVGGEHGVEVMVGGHLTPVRFVGGTAIEGVSGILIGRDGSLWLNTLDGVVRVASEDLAHLLRDLRFPLPYQLYNYLDGLSAKAPQMRPLPSIIQGTGSTLWFSTTNGAFSIDAEHIYRNPVPPPVSVSSVTVDGVRLNPLEATQLPKGASSLQINYSALSLQIPERVLFRYQLEGYDRTWQEAGTRRQALYSHLPPGHYTFRVIACNNDGVWNDLGGSLPIYLPPTFLQSWPFKVLCGIVILLVLRLLVVIRARRETVKVQDRLAERFNERQRIARDLHDTFFQGVQGLLLHVQSAARRLAEGDPARQILDKTLHESDSVMLQGREVLLNLRSTASDPKELYDRLHASAVEFAHLHPSEFDLIVAGTPAPLEPTVCDELAKLGREALCNAYQHANAQRITAHITYAPNVLTLEVSDDGTGIDSQTLRDGGVSNHWGLPGMKERAAAIGASFGISSQSGKGTTIRVSIPAGLAYRHPAEPQKWSIRKLLGEAFSTQ